MEKTDGRFWKARGNGELVLKTEEAIENSQYQYCFDKNEWTKREDRVDRFRMLFHNFFINRPWLF